MLLLVVVGRFMEIPSTVGNMVYTFLDDISKTAALQASSRAFVTHDVVQEAFTSGSSLGELPGISFREVFKEYL